MRETAAKSAGAEIFSNAKTRDSTLGGGLKQPRPTLQIKLIRARSWLKTYNTP
jgi:hypothetical protein